MSVINSVPGNERDAAAVLVGQHSPAVDFFLIDSVIAMKRWPHPAWVPWGREDRERQTPAIIIIEESTQRVPRAPGSGLDNVHCFY
jgi:hypothetical protein